MKQANIYVWEAVTNKWLLFLLDKLLEKSITAIQFLQFIFGWSTNSAQLMLMSHYFNRNIWAEEDGSKTVG